MTKPVKILLACLLIAVGVVVVQDGLRVKEASAVKTYKDIERFAHRHGGGRCLIRQHMVSTYFVRLEYPVFGFIAREFRWGEEVPGGFQTEIVSSTSHIERPRKDSR